MLYGAKADVKSAEVDIVIAEANQATDFHFGGFRRNIPCEWSRAPEIREGRAG